MAPGQAFQVFKACVAVRCVGVCGVKTNYVGVLQQQLKLVLNPLTIYVDFHFKWFFPFFAVLIKLDLTILFKLPLVFQISGLCSCLNCFRKEEVGSYGL